MINRDVSLQIEQNDYDPPRFKHIGHGHAGIITVITEDNHIVTAWVASKEEVKEWLQGR